MEISAPKPWITKLIRYFLGSVFIVASFSKLFALKVFFEQMLAYRFPLSENFVYIAGFILIFVELLIGLSILINFQLSLGLLGLQILLVSMIPITIWGSIHRAPTCGCYGNLFRREPWTATIDDCLMLAISFLLFADAKKHNDTKKTLIYKLLFIVIIMVSAIVYGFFQLKKTLLFQ